MSWDHIIQWLEQSRYEDNYLIAALFLLWASGATTGFITGIWVRRAVIALHTEER